MTDKGLISKTYKQLIQLNTPPQKKIRKWAEELNRHLFKEYMHMAKKYKKICTTLLIFREMKIKTIMSYHLTSAGMATIFLFEDVTKLL